MLNGAGPEGELQTSRGYSTLLDGSRFTLAHDLAFSAKLAGFANNAPRRKFLFTARGCHRETSSDAPRGIRLKTADSARLLGITYEGRGESWGVNKPRCARLITSLASAPGSWPARIDAYLREIPLERCVRDEYARVCLRRGRGGGEGKGEPGNKRGNLHYTPTGSPLAAASARFVCPCRDVFKYRLAGSSSRS